MGIHFSRRRAGLLLLFVLSLLGTPGAGAQTRSGPGAPGTDVVGRMLELKLSTSRPQLTAGSLSSITGILTNISPDSVIYLSESSVTLMLPPELRGPSGSLEGFYAFFASEAQFVVQGSGFRWLPEDSTVLALRPGQSAHLGWQQGTAGTPPDSGSLRLLWRQLGTELSYLFFVPGDYQISVQTKYWTDSVRPPLAYHSTTTTMNVQVVTPQFVILFGAALGGLIAYIIFPARRTHQVVEDRETTRRARVHRSLRVLTQVQKRVGAALLAMLWSAIVTILLSRLGETQFLVRVTVADFWGAIAIGLVAQYVGSKWFEKLFPSPLESQSTSSPAPDVAADAERAAEYPAPRTAEGGGRGNDPPEK